MLIAFAGGATYAEIAALRFIQTQPGLNAEFLFSTTDFINGSTLLQSFQDEVTIAASNKGVLSQ